MEDPTTDVDKEFRSEELDAEEVATGERAERELEEFRDRHLRLAAEFDNYRRRTRREQAELRDRAQADLAAGLLTTLDDLARVAATPGESTTIEALEEGIDLIRRNLLKELTAAGLQRIDAMDARFDPDLHEGMMVVPTDDPDRDDLVSNVITEGYLFRGRLLRPAQVAVLRYTGGPDRADGRADESATTR